MNIWQISLLAGFFLAHVVAGMWIDSLRARLNRLERINRSLEIRLKYLEQDARFYLPVKS